MDFCWGEKGDAIICDTLGNKAIHLHLFSPLTVYFSDRYAQISPKWLLKHQILGANGLDEMDRKISRDLAKPACDVGLLDILLSSLFFVNDSKNQSLVYFSGNK